MCVQTDLVHTLGESAALGAAGVVLWGELKFARSKVCKVCEASPSCVCSSCVTLFPSTPLQDRCVLLRDYIHNLLGPFVQSLRSDTQRCSLLLCHGKGRCARRHPDSGHMFASGPAMTTDPGEIKRLAESPRGFYNHFMCQCYPGWTGQGCQEKTDEKRQETSDPKTEDIFIDVRPSHHNP